MIRKPRLRRITTQPEVFGCAKCGRPSLPHRMFAACQHPVCSECQTGGLTCPKCSTPSTLLVLPSLDSAVEATLAFQCEACQEICPTDAHLCQPIVSAWRARYPTIPETTSDLFPAFALAATQLLTHELPIDKFLEFTVQAVASRSRPVVRPVVPSAAEARTQTVPHRAAAAGGGPVKLYWDFDNMNPKFLGCSVDTFYVNLRTALRGRDIEVDEAFAFVAANKDYGNAPDRLSTMLVTVVTSGFKHEAADRSISRAMQTLVDRFDVRPGTIVLVSSDKDFNADVHRARKSGWRVVVVHDARRGSDHERQLSLHASATIHADEFIKVEDVNPVPPAPYLPQHRFKRTTLVVDGETVPVKDLILNAMVVDLANAEVEHEATFCKKEEAHFVNQCPHVHRMPRTVPVDGWRVETDLLVRNRFVDWIVSNPFHDGKWCTNPHPDHNPEVCQFAHKLPNVRLVSGVLVRLDELVPNAAYNYLKDHPMAPGRWCIDDHDPFTCEQGLHRRNEQRH